MNTIKPNNNSSRRSTQRLMAILAHPDDEALGFGGVLTHDAHRGVATRLITAARGQRGWL